jgi:hypothetical protein
LRAESFSCILDISKLQFVIKKKILKNFSCIFFLLHFLVVKTPDLDPDSLEMSDPERIKLIRIHSSDCNTFKSGNLVQLLVDNDNVEFIK